jgi:hypothetical protein
MSSLRTALLVSMASVLASLPALAQEANPKPRREPLVVGAPPAAGSPSAEAACARERREREKRRAQGLPVAPLNAQRRCLSLNAEQRREPPPRTVDTPKRIPLQHHAGDNRRRRIQQNTGSGDAPKLR